MTDYKSLLKTLVKERMPKTVNGYLIEWRVEIFKTSEHMEDVPEGQVTVMLRGYIYEESTQLHEEETEHGLKTYWLKRKDLARCLSFSDAYKYGHVSRGFHYNEDWLNGEEYHYERESAAYYIFSKAPKDKNKEIRDVMQGFVHDCVQYCVDLEKGWYR